MKTISLDMTITPDEALIEHDNLPDSAPKAKRDAHWRRYSRLKNGLRDPVSYVETADGAARAVPLTTNGVQTPAHQIPEPRRGRGCFESH